MKLARIAAMLALPAVFCLPAQAATEANFAVQTTGDLVALCSADPKEAMGVAALNFCHGFVVGAVRVQQVRGEASKRGRMFCLPEQPTMTRDAAIAEFVTWARAEPVRLTAKPFDSMFQYLGGKFPCQAPKKGM